MRFYLSSQMKQNNVVYEECFNPENATPDSQLQYLNQGKIVNESSLFAEEVQDYILDDDFELKEEEHLTLNECDDGSMSDDNEC